MSPSMPSSPSLVLLHQSSTSSSSLPPSPPPPPREGTPLLNREDVRSNMPVQIKLTKRFSSLLSSSSSSSNLGKKQKQKLLLTSCIGLVFVTVVVAVIVIVLSPNNDNKKPPTQTFHQKPIPQSEAREGYISIENGRMSLWYRTWGNPPSYLSSSSSPVRGRGRGLGDKDNFVGNGGGSGGGIPVLFVHGGPGNAVSDYGSINSEFFYYQKFYVIEVDQRGTGKSLPSVRDLNNDSKTISSYYKDISIDVMSADYEVVRNQLGIEKWLVFGGSWGSTLGLDYCTRYSQFCLGLIIRGIFLDTKPEFDAIYGRRAFEIQAKEEDDEEEEDEEHRGIVNNVEAKNVVVNRDLSVGKRRLQEFDTFFSYAAKQQQQDTSSSSSSPQPLNPYDSEKIVRTYERLIQSGNEMAIWKFFVFEYNLMEEDPSKRLDPDIIVQEMYPEARSVSFFESRLFLRGTFQDPINLLGRVHGLLNSGSGDEVDYLSAFGLRRNYDAIASHENEKNQSKNKPVYTWICQGTGDGVCPDKYARELVQELEHVGVPYTARFINAGHLAGSTNMKACLKQSIADFTERYYSDNDGGEVSSSISFQG